LIYSDLQTWNFYGVGVATTAWLMFTNYLKIAFRNLFKSKVHSFINITGLALGMAAATLLLLNIQHGLSIDQFHEKKASLYLAYNKGDINSQVTCWNATAAPLATALKNFPEVKNVARVQGVNILVRYEDKKIAAAGNVTDPGFLSMFSFPLLAGNIQTALSNPNDIVLTPQLATKLFGSQDPVNKIITTPSGSTFTVTGVLRDLPTNTQFDFEYLMSWSHLRNPGSWKNQNTFTYVELAPGADLDAVNKKIAAIITNNNPGEQALSTFSIFLYPLTKVWLEGRFVNGKPAGGNIDNLKMLGGLAAIILLIACINFMNLSTARSEKRAKEVGIRKVVGAERHSLIFQFIGESVLMALLAAVIALMLVTLILPHFGEIIETKLSIPWQSPFFWFAALAFILLTGLLAGSYPAFYLSSFKPIKVLKGILQNGNALITPRKVMVVVQFVFSIFLINFTVIYQKQIRYELNREVGYSKDNLVFHTLTPDLRDHYATVKNELLGAGIASSVSEANTTVTRDVGAESGLRWAGMDPKANPVFVLMMENGGFVQTSGLSLIAGRDIDIEKYPGDTLSCVINETSARILGFKQPIGSIINDEDERWKIVGVVKDFLVDDPGQGMPPVLIKGAVSPGVINIRLARNRPFDQNVREAEAILKKYNPSYITDLQFADKDYESKFQQVRNTALLINTFTFVAIFVSCMGLLGLAIYTTENRTREIGIRKVLGSSIGGIVTLLTRDFVKLVLVSILIASPLAWFFMHNFLLHYSYRTTVDGWVLLISGIAALFLALVTIGFQVIRAAMANPVRNLRTE
jgi:putative ABC transport system permease protein